MPKKVAVILAGCGFKDGAEIRESVLALTALSEEGAEVQCFAPDIDVAEIDHLNFKPTGQKRNVLKEAARIARGKIFPVTQLDAKNFDALVMPGGFGAATNLSNFAQAGPHCEVEAGTAKAIESFISANKPIGAICIAPAVVAKVFSKHGGVKLTVGETGDASKAIEAMGSQHIPTKPDGIAIDGDRKVVSTPAYMYDSAPLAEISKGIHSLVKQVMAFTQN